MPAVLKHNLSADDGRLARLAVQLLGQGHDGHSLLAPFQALHEQLQVQAQVKARIPDRAALLALSPKMLTPGRADNNLAAVDERIVQQLLIEAWG
jgi:alcohol dehydrogenase class IV